MISTIRAKIIIFFVLISTLFFSLVIFSISRINSVAQTAYSVIRERMPLSLCCEEALLALASGENCIDKLLVINNPEDLDRIADVEAMFRESIIDFDMFANAMLWGSGENGFRESNGGLTYLQWHNKGWENKIVVVKAPDSIRQSVEKAAVYYTEFVRYMKESIKSQKRILRLMLKGSVSESFKERKNQEECIKKARFYRNLASKFLATANSDTQEFIAKATRTIEHIYALARSGMIIYSAITLCFLITGGYLFYDRTIILPLSKLRTRAEIIGKGRLDYQAGTNAKDEIGQLSRTFDQMVNNLIKITASRDELDRQINVRIRLEEALVKKNAEILEFTNTVTHDLKKPLTVMKTISNLTKSRAASSCDPEFIEATQIGAEAIGYMQEMLDDLLACAKLEAGTQELVVEEFCVKESVEKVVHRLKYPIEEKHIAVTMSEKDLRIKADMKQFERLLMNLVGNAINYIGDKTDKRISIGWEQRDGKTAYTVEDNGIGIPIETQSHLFTKFKRGANVSGISGTGLGLSIVKGIVLAHGGKIWFESTEGEGTAFHFTL